MTLNESLMDLDSQDLVDKEHTDDMTEAAPLFALDSQDKIDDEPPEQRDSTKSKYLRKVPLIDVEKRDGPWKTIIMLGETGTGKTTTLNSMVNYLFGVEYHDNFRYVLVDNEDVADQSRSVTQAITAYHFKPTAKGIDYGVTLVDAPGFNDTRGLARDAEIWKMIKEYFENVLSELDAVCFTVKSTCARFTPCQRYVYSQILGLFGNDIEANLFILLTFCDGKRPPALHAIKAANIPCDSRCIKLNNSAFFNGFEALLSGREECDDGEDFESDLIGGYDLSQVFWQIGISAFEDFFTVSITKVPKSSLVLTRDVLKDREQLETIVVALNRQIREALDALECIRLTVQQIKIHQEDLDAHADFKVKVSKPKCTKIDLSGKGVHTTTCRTCNFTCHRSCKFANDSDKQRCVSMCNGFCSVCPRKCAWHEHSNVPYWLEYTTVVVEEIALSKQAAAEAASEGISNTEAVIREKRDMYVCIQHAVARNIMQVHTINNHLRAIALHPQALDADDHFIAMIDAESHSRQPGYKARVAAIKRVQEEAKLLRGVVDGNVTKKVDNMDHDLRQIDRDMQEVAQRYTKAREKVQKNGGSAKRWVFGDFLPVWLR